VRIGLALGSGAARGWAHLGVLQALEETGVVPDIICGTSVGALVGAAYLTDQLEPLQAWARKLGLLGMLGMLDLKLSRGGLMAIERVFERFRNARTDIGIETLPKTFAAVATDLATGREVWLRDGPLLDSVRASAAMPGLFPAVPIGGQWLVDGALVNPVPVSLCRALGADVVIAVNLNAEMSALPRLSRPPAEPAAARESRLRAFAQEVGARFARRRPEGAAVLVRPPAPEGRPAPTLVEVVAGSIDIMQDRITRARLAGDPPDVTIAPRLGHIGILDFDRGEEMVRIGRLTTESLRPAIDLAIRRA
jgi:NTE family protein